MINPTIELKNICSILAFSALLYSNLVIRSCFTLLICSKLIKAWGYAFILPFSYLIYLSICK